MSLQVSTEEYERWQRDQQCKENRNSKLRANHFGGKFGTKQKTEKWRQQRTRKPRLTKQVSADIEPIENTWIRSVLKLQYHVDSGRAYIETGVTIKKRSVTYSSPLGVVYPEKEDRIWR